MPLRLSGTHSLAAVLDRDGRLVAAMTSPRGLVLASISLNGGVRHRQSFTGVDGYVSVETDSLGRVSATLIYDSGISVGDGECISEGRVPMIRASIRGTDSQLFEPVRTLATPAFNCLGGNALLRTVNRHFFVVAFQAAGETQGGLVRQSVSAGRERFTGESDLVGDADLADALALRHSGSLLVAFTARPVGATRGHAALSVYTHPARTRQEIAPASADPLSPLLALDAAGHAVLAWHEGTTLKVARDLGA